MGKVKDFIIMFVFCHFINLRVVVLMCNTRSFKFLINESLKEFNFLGIIPNKILGINFK